MEFLSGINYMAVAAASVVSFIIGTIWYSGLFGSMWVEELKQHKIKIKEPSRNELVTKMLLTLGANILTAFTMAYLVNLTGSSTLDSGLTLGIVAAVGFAATTLSSVFVWESRSLKLFLIDFGYPALSIIASAVILSLWY